jgi:ferric-dicitrate binding protein FerR (iron transport regulator)
LTAVDALFQRITTKTEDQLRRARDKGHLIKVQEEEASRARLARMWAEEERERQALEEARARQRRRDRRLIIALVIFVGLGILAVLVLFTALGPIPSPF